jgi:phytanoyl-CoA hydroxylase
MLTQEQKQFFDTEGYFVARGLFKQSEIDFYKTHYEAMRLAKIVNNPTMGDDAINESDDPLIEYPRIMQPHRQDQVSLDWLIDERINKVMIGLLGKEPFAVQTMFYFKPPGARGQALHQDQYYLRVQPGTCIAAWMAVDDCDEDNGCLRVVPGSQDWPLLCMTESDTNLSFTDVMVDVLDEEIILPVKMKAGDVLFFNGQLVHGSLPNTTSDRFRCALIGHYIVGEAEKVYRSYHPVLRMDGTVVEFGESETGGTCGVWVSVDGEPQLQMKPEQTRGE